MTGRWRGRTGSEWEEGPWVGGGGEKIQRWLAVISPVSWLCLAPGPSPPQYQAQLANDNFTLKKKTGF